MRDFDRYFFEKVEPQKSCLMALRDIILAIDPNISTAWKYRMPFFCYKTKMFCYLRIDKTTNEPYIGIVEGRKIDHPQLEQGARSRMKILRVNPNSDIPIHIVSQILRQAIALYK